MAGTSETQQEMAVHEKGYVKFLAMMKWGAILSLLTGLIVVLLIAE